MITTLPIAFSGNTGLKTRLQSALALLRLHPSPIIISISLPPSEMIDRTTMSTPGWGRPLTVIVVLLLSSTDRWDLLHMKRLVDGTTIWIWCRNLARAGFPVQTTANDDRRLTTIIE